MISNRGTPPPELEIARIFRLVNEGAGYEELINLAIQGQAVGWTPARERVIQDGLRLRLTQLFNKRVNFQETLEFIETVSACVAEVRFTNALLAERLKGFQLVAEQMLQRPGDIPSKLLLKDPTTSQLLLHLSVAPAEERTLEALIDKFSPGGSLDTVLWPLLNLNYIRKCVDNESGTYELGDELANYFQIAAEDGIGSGVPGPDVINLVVPVQPIFDFLTLAYADEQRLAARYRVNVRKHRGVRHNRNWFSIDEFYFDDRDVQTKTEIRAAILPRSSMVEGSRRNSIDVLPTNAFVGFHWMIAREEVRGIKPRIFSSDGELVPVFRKVSEIQKFFSGRHLIILLDEPMTPHACLVLNTVLGVDERDYTIVRREDNVARLSELNGSGPNTLTLAISTSPMLAMADEKKHAILFQFSDMVKAYRSSNHPYEVFADTVFHCAVNISVLEEDWRNDGMVRDVSYRIHLMMKDVIDSILLEPVKYANFIESLWKTESKSGPDPESYAHGLSSTKILHAMKCSYIWIGDAGLLCSGDGTSWTNQRGKFFWSHQEDFFFPTLVSQLKIDIAEANETLTGFVDFLKISKKSKQAAEDMVARVRSWIDHGSPNFATKTMNSALIGARKV